MRPFAWIVVSGAWFSQVAAAQEVPVPSPSSTAPATAPYAVEEVTVRSPYGHSLGGALTLPHHAPRPVPAVILISGTGSQTRDGSAPGDTAHRPFQQIADTLARRGVAVLRLDDRGVREGRQLLTSPLHVSEDVRAALMYLRARDDIDASRLGLIGHSEGGMVALMVAASDPTLTALVLMGAPAERPADMLREMMRRSVAKSHRTEAERDSVFHLAGAGIERQLQTDWGRLTGTYEPLVAARALRTRSVLVMHGATDWQVPPEHADRLAAAIREAGVCDVTQRTFAQLNHLFLVDPEGVVDYQSLPTQDLPGAVLGVLADWIASRMTQGRPTAGEGAQGR